MIDPTKALFWSAVINSVVAVPVMAMMMHPSAYSAAPTEAAERG